MGPMDANSIIIEPVHVHMKQLYNNYSFFPSITYYRKCNVDVGKVDGHVTTSALCHAMNDIDNWLFSFDAVYNGDSIQSQFVLMYHVFHN